MTSEDKAIREEGFESRDIFLTSDERFDVWSVKQAERPHLLQYSYDDSASLPNKGVGDYEKDRHTENSSISHSKKMGPELQQQEDITSQAEDDDVDIDADAFDADADAFDVDSDVDADADAAFEHDDGDDETKGSLPLPLLDGCDLPGWRKEGLVLSQDSPHHNHQQGMLNVGLGCTLMRRTSQLSACLSDKLLKQSAWKQLQAKLFVQPPIVSGTATGGPSEVIVDGRTAAIRLPSEETERLTGPHAWFEKQNIPVILEGCTDSWNAMKTCTWKSLLQEYGDYQWRFSDTHGACMSLETYTKYTKSIEGLTDDAPLAVYDSQLHLDERAELLKEYQVPTCFDGMDLFQDVMMMNESIEDETAESKQPPTEESTEGQEAGEASNDKTSQGSATENCNSDSDSASEANSSTLSSASSWEGPTPPPYRWILMGPARSGTGLHIDPLGTHAWVTVVEGCKRWVLFPPDTNQASIGMQDPQIPSSIWFAQWYPRLQKEFQTTFNGAVEVLQRPGDTVYVPAGWPHLVLNLEDTVAITHNYASEYPRLSLLQEAVQEAEPELYKVWWPKLRVSRPDLFVVDNKKESEATSGTQEEKKEG
ncbi:MAG: hypothetical protein SGBAC_011446 [Bacillariaceae sp.]